MQVHAQLNATRPNQSVHQDAIKRTNQRLGYKNNWHRNPVDENFQIRWQTPFQSDDAVAVIGGGISGLACAQVSKHTNVLLGGVVCWQQSLQK